MSEKELTERVAYLERMVEILGKLAITHKEENGWISCIHCSQSGHSGQGYITKHDDGCPVGDLLVMQESED